MQGILDRARRAQRRREIGEPDQAFPGVAGTVHHEIERE
jgi:hypothetical protein